MTVCSTSDLDEKNGRLKKKTQGSCNEFSELNSPSIESSDSVQHNEGNLETRRTGGARTNKRTPEEENGRYLSSSVRPVAFPPYIECRRWYSISSVLGLGRGRLCPVATVLWSNFSSRISACPPIIMFLAAELLLISKASLGSSLRCCCGFPKRNLHFHFFTLIFCSICVM